MGHLFIDELEAGRAVNEVYMVTQPVLRNTTRGDLYIAMFLSDRTGKVNGRMWQATEGLYQQLPTEGFVRVRGKSELYQNAMQIVINDVQVLDAKDVDLSDYMPKTDKDVGEMFGEVQEIMGEIVNGDLKALVGAFLADEDLMRKFCIAPAAMQMHHAYLGGLLEHTHSMLKVAEAVLPLYPKVQSDMVLAAVFLHDIAKTWELSYDTAFSYTDGGQLLGHIVQGITMINEKAAQLADGGQAIGKEVIASLSHVILAHHGQYDFGSPKLPATAEAFMVSYLDNLDAKMNQVVRAVDNDKGNSDWTPWVNSLQTRLYKKRVAE